MKKRGTWFNRASKTWYEIDGFITREEGRHRIVHPNLPTNIVHMLAESIGLLLNCGGLKEGFKASMPVRYS